MHAARPDVVAAAHSHSVYGKAWSTLGRLLDPLTQDACAFYEDHALFDDYTGVVLDLEEGKRIAHALGENKAVILRNHGLLTVGHTRRRGRVVVHHDGAHAARPSSWPRPPARRSLIDDDVARQTCGQVGSHLAGWFSVQPLYDWIVRDQPDLLSAPSWSPSRAARSEPTA